MAGGLSEWRGGGGGVGSSGDGGGVLDLRGIGAHERKVEVLSGLLVHLVEERVAQLEQRLALDGAERGEAKGLVDELGLGG